MIIFPPNPASQTPTNVFSPTSTPLSTDNYTTYTYDGEKWVAAPGIDGGGLFKEVASIDCKKIVGNDRVHWTKLLAFPDGCVGVVSRLTDDGKSGGLDGVEILW